MLALPAPSTVTPRRVARKQRRALRAAKAGGRKTSPGTAEREKQLRALWPTDKSTPAIAGELGCTPACCYQIARRLKLGKRPPSARAKRRARASRPIAAKPAKPAAEKAPAPAPRSRRVMVSEKSANARPAPRPSVAQRSSSPATPTRPALPPVPPDEQSAVDRFIAEKGVRREANFGEHQAVVDAARSIAFEVLRLKTGYQQPSQWSLNGASVQTSELYSRVNAELKRRGRDPIAPPQKATAG